MENDSIKATLAIFTAYLQVDRDYVQTSHIFNVVDRLPAEVYIDYQGTWLVPRKGIQKQKQGWTKVL